jgi:hypothetical protein
MMGALLLLATGTVLTQQTAADSQCGELQRIFDEYIRCGRCEATHNILTPEPMSVDIDGDGHVDLVALVCISAKVPRFQGEFAIQKPLPNDLQFDPRSSTHVGAAARDFLTRSGPSLRISNFLAVSFGAGMATFKPSPRKLLLDGGWLSPTRMTAFRGVLRDWPLDNGRVIRAPTLGGNALYFENVSKSDGMVIYWDGVCFRYHPVDPAAK